MKKLLAVAAIGVVGYYVVKKIKERKNEEVEEMENKEVENVEEEVKEEKINNEVEEDDRILQYLGPDEYIVADEEVIIDYKEIKEEGLFNKVKGLGKKLIKAPIQLVVKVCGIICGVLVSINKGIENSDRSWCKIEIGEPINFKYHLKYYVGNLYLIILIAVVMFNRCVLLALGLLCKMLNKLI